MKKYLSKNKLGITIILLVIIFIVQAILIKKMALSGNILDPRLTKEFNNPNFYVWQLAKGIWEDQIPENSNILLLNSSVEEADNITEFGLAFVYLQLDFYPQNLDYIYYYNRDYFDVKFIKQNTNFDMDYVIVLGEKFNFIDHQTSKKLTLLKMNNDYTEVEKIIDFDFNLYDIYLEYINMNKEKEFLKIVEKIKYNIRYYNDGIARELILNFADRAYEEKDYKIALIYSNYFLNNVYHDNEIITENLGNYYLEKKDYKKARNYFETCLENKLCNKSEVQEKLKYIEMNGEK